MNLQDTRQSEVMPVEVNEGSGGHILLCQEWSTLTEESYSRILINARDAERIAMRILTVAREIRGS